MRTQQCGFTDLDLTLERCQRSQQARITIIRDKISRQVAASDKASSRLRTMGVSVTRISTIRKVVYLLISSRTWERGPLVEAHKDSLSSPNSGRIATKSYYISPLWAFQGHVMSVKNVALLLLLLLQAITSSWIEWLILWFSSVSSGPCLVLRGCILRIYFSFSFSWCNVGLQALVLF